MTSVLRNVKKFTVTEEVNSNQFTVYSFIYMDCRISAVDAEFRNDAGRRVDGERLVLMEKRYADEDVRFSHPRE